MEFWYIGYGINEMTIDSKFPFFWIWNKHFMKKYYYIWKEIQIDFLQAYTL